MTDQALSPARIALRVLAMLLAAALLTLALAHHNVWPTLWVRVSTEYSVEVAIFVLLLALWRERAGPLSRPAVWGLAALVFAVALGRYIDVTAPAVFGRRVNLYWDLQHLPSVFHMLNEAMPTARFVLGLALGAVSLALLALLSRWIVKRLDAGFSIPVARRGMIAASLGLIGVYAAGMLSDRIDTERFFAIPVTPVYAQQAAEMARNMSAEGRAQVIDGVPLPASNMKGLGGSDVIVIFLESYGGIAWENPVRSTAVQPAIRKAGKALSAAGWHIASAKVDAPTFGGASWLSHGSFLSGAEIREQHNYNRLLASGRETLVDRFRKAGYRTAALFPGVKRAWPEGAAYRFDRIYDAKAVDYRGPAFGWWAIPDQASLARVHAAELSATRARKPLFLFFPTISSHMPFEPVPIYQPDWTRILSDMPFDPAPLKKALARQPDGKALAESWARATRYNFEWVPGYIAKLAPKDAIFIVIGDHQPPALITGKTGSWRTPVHIIARDPAKLAGFLKAGFLAGIKPPEKSIGGMEILPHLLLKSFDTAPRSLTQRGGDSGG